MGLLTLAAMVQNYCSCLPDVSCFCFNSKCPLPSPTTQIHSWLYSWSYIFITRGKFTLTLETRPTFLKDSVSMGYTREMALDQKSGLQSCIALGL